MAPRELRQLGGNVVQERSDTISGTDPQQSFRHLILDAFRLRERESPPGPSSHGTEHLRVYGFVGFPILVTRQERVHAAQPELRRRNRHSGGQGLLKYNGEPKILGYHET